MNCDAAVLIVASTADLHVQVGIVIRKALLDLTTNFVFQSKIKVASNAQRSREREEQAPLKNRPASVNQASEDGRDSSSVGARSSAQAHTPRALPNARAVKYCDCADWGGVW